jgi:hypothetical protein
MTDLVRTQVLLSRNQRQSLLEIAHKDGRSLSDVVREALDAQLRQRQYQEMEIAAGQLLELYETDPDLTAMTALDGEDFADE